MRISEMSSWCCAMAEDFWQTPKGDVQGLGRLKAQPGQPGLSCLAPLPFQGLALGQHSLTSGFSITTCRNSTSYRAACHDPAPDNLRRLR